MFCSTDLAAEIERAEAELMAACASGARAWEPQAFAIPVAGGFATYAGGGSPFTKVAGLGFGPTPSAAELDRVEAAFAAVGTGVSVELSALADPDVLALLTGRGYRLLSFENVSGGRLVPGAPPGPPRGITLERADEDLDTWLDVVVEGSLHPDDAGLVAHEEFPSGEIVVAERLLVRAGARPYLARRDGEPAGGGSFRAAARVAQLTGAATLPAHRRRGVQSALLAARLSDAAAAGCELAVVTTQPGSTSQQNVQRAGFDLLYTRVILVKSSS